MSIISSQVANIFISKCLDSSTAAYQKTMEQLSSGRKFTSMGDDPMGMTEATNLEVKINFNSRVQTNIEIGSDMLSMTASYQDNILSNIQRIRDLTTQAATGTYSVTDKDSILSEIKARLASINTIVDSANFNDLNILDGSNTALTIKVGPSPTDTINIGSTLINVDTTALGIDVTDPMTDDDWSNYLTKLDSAAKILTNNCSKIGAYVNRLDSISNGLTNMNNNLTEYKSTISDTDTAEVSADLVKYQILQQAATTVFVQANQVRQLAYSLLETSS